MPHVAGHTGNAAMDKCIDDCQHCAALCHACVAHCLKLGGEHADPQHIALLLDCAAICEASAASMSRQSSVHGQLCAACAEICRLCEESCRALGNEGMLKECADACRRCADSCEKMAA